MLDRVLAVEVLQGSILVAPRQVDQTQHPLKRDGAESRDAGGGVGREACLELTRRLRLRLPCHVHGCRKPVRKRKVWKELEGPVCGSDARGPGLCRLRIEATGLARVVRGQRERFDIGLRVRARHLEVHDAGVGHADVGRCELRCALHDALEHAPGAGDPIRLECLQCRSAFEERAVRPKQGVERFIALSWRDVRHVGHEPIAAPCHGLDEHDAAPIGRQADGAGSR